MKINRQIGYVKEKEVIETIQSNSNELGQIKIEDLPEIIKTKSKKITDWIKSHPAIKWSLICKNVGIDKGNFQKVLKSDSPSIKIENIIKLEKELKKYGYA